MDGSAAIDPAVGQFWHKTIGDFPPCLSTEIQRAAYAILWMGLRGEREGLPSMLATSFAEAAAVSEPAIGLGAHQEHRVNYVAQATDWTKVLADVIQLAEQTMSEVMQVIQMRAKVRVAKCLTMQLAVYLAKEVGNYRDGSWESNIRLLTGTIKVDWIQLPVEQYLATLPTLKQGVFRQKVAASWGITRAEKLQLSVFLANNLSLEDWYAGVYGLPTVWLEVSDNLRKVAGYDFHHLRKKYDVRTMWEDLDPQWRLLQSQLKARRPGWYSPAELKERLFTNKSKRPGDDTKETLRTDENIKAWQTWHAAHDLIWQSCRPGPLLVFPGEKSLSVWTHAAIHEFADSQFGHLFARGENCEEARKTLVLALSNLEVVGQIRTPIEYLVELLRTEAFRMNSIDTSWLDGMIREKTVKIKYEKLDVVFYAAVFRAVRQFQVRDQDLAEAIAKRRLGLLHQVGNSTLCDALPDPTVSIGVFIPCIEV
eukprot:symbB.v1.2.029136.t1/scaffold3148.1/size62448/5